MSKKDKKTDNQQKFNPVIRNKKAGFNYILLDKFEAGIILEGTEVKSLRMGRATLDDSYCRIKDGQLQMIGCNISVYEYGNICNHEPLRVRQLLVHKQELLKFEIKLNQKGFTLVPTKIYFSSRGYAKVEIALAQGKTLADKRSKMKEQQVKMDIKRAMSKYR